MPNTPPLKLESNGSEKKLSGLAAEGGRLPPHSLEAEMGVLACIVIDCGSEALAETIRLLPEAHEAFYDLRNRTIYKELLSMFERGDTVDWLTLLEALRQSGNLERAGGEGYLIEFPQATHSAANLPYYLEILKSKSVLRRIISSCNQAITIAYDSPQDTHQALDEVERMILSISQDREHPSLGQLVKETVAKLQEWHDSKETVSGLKTGFADFDRLTLGLHPGEMVVIAARPSMGKTSLAMNIAEEVAREHPVGIFSLEMTADQLVLRMLCSRAEINMRDAREGVFEDHEFQRITQASGQISQLHLYLDDTPALKILELKARARRMHQKHGIKLVVIDYLQLLQASGRSENRQQEITAISAGIKSLAKELKIPVVVLSQLNREVENRQGKPRMSDLRESGSIEQDADVVGLLYVPDEEQDRVEAGESSHGVNLLIAKQRNGPTDDIPLTFRKNFTKFSSRASQSEGGFRPGAQD